MELGNEKLDASLVKSQFGDLCKLQCDPHVNIYGVCCGDCFKRCPRTCKNLLFDGILPPPPLPVPPIPATTTLILPRTVDEAQKHVIVTGMMIMGGLIGAAVLVCILCAIIRVHYSRQRNSRNSRIPPVFFGTQEDFLNQDLGPEIDHPIWYINTIGLQQSIIDSIAVFKYKKEEELIEGTECSVCLNEFQEDDTLRLLPKCSHAFHIPCIDTWLRSHKNCPLCRAPIVCDNFHAQVDLSVPTTSDLSSRGETQMENSENNSEFMSEVGEDGTGEESNGDNMNCVLSVEGEMIDGNVKMSLNLSVLRNHSRVQSDLVDSKQALEAEIQPMRRSVSMDSASAIAIHNAMANVGPGKHQENLGTQMLKMKYSKSKNVSKRGSNGNLSFRKLMKSSSLGHALQHGRISMKRSSSSNGRSSSSSSSSRHSRSQDSILPI